MLQSWRVRSRASSAAMVLASMLILTATQASACIVLWPFDEGLVDYADTIIRARPTGHEILQSEHSAKLTFEVVEVYRGSAQGQAIAAWQNSTYELPANHSHFSRAYGDDLIVGLVAPGGTEPMDYASGAITGPRHPALWEIPWVLQQPCRPPFMGEYLQMEPLLRRRGVIE